MVITDSQPHPVEHRSNADDHHGLASSLVQQTMVITDSQPWHPLMLGPSPDTSDARRGPETLDAWSQPTKP